jgi:hypothetical protein
MMKAVIALTFVSVAAKHEVKEWAEKYCASAKQLASEKLTTEDMKKFFADFSGLFTEKVDCSQDPFNPIIGVDLKGVTFGECAAATAKANAKLPKAEISGFTCLEIIADEKAGTGAIWLEYGNSGKYRTAEKTRSAFRFKMHDGKCSAYHIVFDSYNLFHADKSEALAASSVGGFAGVMGLGVIVGATIAGVKMSKSKKGVLLEHEVIA